MTAVAALLVLGLVVALDVLATARLLRSDAYSAAQKAAQTILLWCVPLLGAMLVLHLLRESQGTIPAQPTDEPLRDIAWTLNQSEGHIGGHTHHDVATRGDS